MRQWWKDVSVTQCYRKKETKGKKERERKEETHHNFAAYFIEEWKRNSQVCVKPIAVTWRRVIISRKLHYSSSSSLLQNLRGRRENFLLFCRIPEEKKKGNYFSLVLYCSHRLLWLRILLPSFLMHNMH